MFIKQLSVFVENSAGKLQQIIEGLGEGGVNLRALSIAETADFGILRLIVDDEQKARGILKEMGVISKTTDVIAVYIDDKTGGLAAVLKTFAENNVNIEYMYAFLGRKEGKALMVLKADDEEKAAQTLRENGLELASPEII
jgi:hypothetical protein